MALCAALSARILLQKHQSQKVPEGRCELTGNSGRSHGVCEAKSMEQDLKAVLNNSSIIINLVTSSSHTALRWEWCPRFAEVEIQASRNGAIIPRYAAENRGSAFLGRCAIHRAALPPYRDQGQWHRNSLLAVFSSLVGALGKYFPLEREQRWAMEVVQRQPKGRLEAGLPLQPGAWLVVWGFFSPLNWSQHIQ